MPFVSQAQRRKFYSDPKLRKYVPEFEAATPKDKILPERAPKKLATRVRDARRKVMGHGKKKR